MIYTSCSGLHLQPTGWGRRVPHSCKCPELRMCQGCNCVFRSLYHRGMISPGTLVLLSAFPTPREAPITTWGDQRENKSWVSRDSNS